jgi:hypothetical protein
VDVVVVVAKAVVVVLLIRLLADPPALLAPPTEVEEVDLLFGVVKGVCATVVTTCEVVVTEGVGLF